jgi:hypothetical protein
MLKPIMGPLSGLGSGGTGIVVWTPPLGIAEGWVGIRVWIEAGSECSGEGGVVEDVEVCVGVNDDNDDDDNESFWRFAKR